MRLFFVAVQNVCSRLPRACRCRTVCFSAHLKLVSFKDYAGNVACQPESFYKWRYIMARDNGKRLRRLAKETIYGGSYGFHRRTFVKSNTFLSARRRVN